VALINAYVAAVRFMRTMVSLTAFVSRARVAGAFVSGALINAYAVVVRSITMRSLAVI